VVRDNEEKEKEGPPTSSAYYNSTNLSARCQICSSLQKLDCACKGHCPAFWWNLQAWHEHGVYEDDLMCYRFKSVVSGSKLGAMD